MNGQVDIGELLGMVIAFVAVVYTLVTSFANIYKGKKPLQKPLEDIYKEVFKEQSEDAEEDEWVEEAPKPKKLPPPPQVAIQSVSRSSRRPEEKFEFHSTLDTFRQRTAIEDRKLEIKLRTGEELVSEKLKELQAPMPAHKVETPSPVRTLLKKIHSKKALIIAAEIINPPLCLRGRASWQI